jgi:hypothetical protein
MEHVAQDIGNGGVQASHHATIVPHVATTVAGYSVAMCTFVGVLQSTMVGLSTDVWTPYFVVVPHDVEALSAGATEIADGAWETYGTIAREAYRDARLEAEREPSACPNDGEPLDRAPGGGLFCPFDGWRPGSS